MSLSGLLAQQLARPTGMVGRALAPLMERANRTPVRLALELLDARAGEVVLDVGCGNGAALADVRASGCKVVGIDASDDMVAMARRRLGPAVRIDHGRVEALRYADASFDAVLALNVLYFAARDDLMAREILRVLKPGGRLVAYVTSAESMANWGFVSAGLHRLFDKGALTDMLVGAGFAPADVSVHAKPMCGSVVGLFACATRS